MPFSRLSFSLHAIQRMFERGISRPEVRHVLATGEVIEDYPHSAPYPSYLMLGWSGTRPIHVVAADNDYAKQTIVVTVYEPNLFEWEPDFKRRRP